VIFLIVSFYLITVMVSNKVLFYILLFFFIISILSLAAVAIWLASRTFSNEVQPIGFLLMQLSTVHSRRRQKQIGGAKKISQNMNNVVDKFHVKNFSN